MSSIPLSLSTKKKKKRKKEKEGNLHILHVTFYKFYFFKKNLKNRYGLPKNYFLFLVF